ncbi:hypothetical protein QN379_04360 [Glaciimonas sp. Gout2]|nr:hypothetical protein [Glaciimonas sp. Gout2]
MGDNAAVSALVTKLQGADGRDQRHCNDREVACVTVVRWVPQHFVVEERR